MNTLFVCHPCHLFVPLFLAAWDPLRLTWRCPRCTVAAVEEYLYGTRQEVPS